MWSRICDDWQHARLALLVEGFGMATGIVAAVLISSYQHQASFMLIYSMFLLSSVALAFSAYMRRNSFLVFLNIVYTIININGLLRAIVG